MEMDFDTVAEWATRAGVVVALYVAIVWVSTVFWTYRDIRRRSRSYGVQAMATLFVLAFFLPGLWVYLILRPRLTLAQQYVVSLEQEALLQELELSSSCPDCKRAVHDDFLLCPACKTTLKEPCVACMKPLGRTWLACPFCGQDRVAPPAPKEAPAPAAEEVAPPVIAGRKVPAFARRSA